MPYSAAWRSDVKALGTFKSPACRQTGNLLRSQSIVGLNSAFELAVSTAVDAGFSLPSHSRIPQSSVSIRVHLVWLVYCIFTALQWSTRLFELFIVVPSLSSILRTSWGVVLEKYLRGTNFLQVKGDAETIRASYEREETSGGRCIWLRWWKQFPVQESTEIDLQNALHHPRNCY